MRIEFDNNKRVFRLYNAQMEYAFAIAGDGRLVNLHWGAPVGSADDYEVFTDDESYMDVIPRHANHSEYRMSEPFDYAKPCIRAKFSDGTENIRMIYKSHRIEGGTLYVTLADKVKPLEVELKYKTWDELPLISRSCTIKNTGDDAITLKSAKSASVYMPDNRDYRLTHMSGDYGAEYQKNQTLVSQSKIYIETGMLTQGAMQEMPFFALDEKGASTETCGEVYFGVLEWSGDFQIIVEKNTYSFTGSNVTVSAGISDFTSNYQLLGGEAFETPQLTIGYSDRGFEKMSETFYDWEYDYLLPKGTTDKAHSVHPVIYNTWFPYEFSIDEEKLLSFIPKAKYIGAELLVMDDGWMKGRINAITGLGDWEIDRERFPNGLGVISDATHKAGMKFGLWVEPEMANEDSNLFRTHRDWFILDPNHENTLMRSQYILDMSRDEIRNWAINWLDKLIIEAKLDYVKWDMNRILTEVCPHFTDNGTAIKYIKNIYYIWEHLNKKFPDLLLENCASGSGRIDFGMLKYADRVNRSDTSEPINVLSLHEGFSTLFVPKTAGGAGNIAPSGMNGHGRDIPLNFRTKLGMISDLSVGVNLLKSSDEEIEELKKALAEYKEIREGLQDSYVYRIASIRENPYVSFEYLKRDRSEFTLFTFGHGMTTANHFTPLLKMRGLEPDSIYACGDKKMSGKALMNIGIKVSINGDYANSVMTWKKEK